MNMDKSVKVYSWNFKTIGLSLVEFAFTTTSICIALALGVMFCCLYIKFSDMRMARRENLLWEYSKTKHRANNSGQPGQEAECCAIYVPDAGIITL